MSSTILIAYDSQMLLKILSLAFAGFMFSMALTPLYTTVAYNRRWWKLGRTIPTMAGLVFVASTALVTLGNLSRQQTWLPLAAMVGSSIVGLVEDWINIRRMNHADAGLRTKLKFFLHCVVALVGGWWFYSKLGITSIDVPLFGVVHLGLFIIPLFAVVVVASANAVSISDGLDGLAGGLLASSFTIYSVIAFIEGKYGLAGFCLTIVGALLSYTWFNVFPARFFMGDVGSFALGTALGIVAMLTNTVFLLPIIGFVYVAETVSVIINWATRKLWNGKKVFLNSPVHRHFEAKGWPETKVTMRFWVFGQVMGVFGLMLFLLNWKW